MHHETKAVKAVKIIQRGAEAILYLRGEELVKERVAKGYRIPELDLKIRKQRTRGEAKLMERARGGGVSVPRARIEDDFRLVMEHVKGERLKESLNSMNAEERKRSCAMMGEAIAKLHAGGVIHGDLTTSNMILSGGRLFLIDFGLGKFSDKTEDQAVDLFLLYEALKSTHFAFLEECWESVAAAYAKHFPLAKDVLSRMEKIKKRRRYK
jgi:TP53 regulating kinase-like protein